MAKRKKTAPKGVTFKSDISRHTKKMTIPADSTTAVSELLDTPGHKEKGYSGAWIDAIVMSPAPNTSKFHYTTSLMWALQLQAGDRLTANALLMPDDPAFFGQILYVTSMTTSGAVQRQFPLRMQISRPVPIIVMPQMTFTFDATVNSADIANADIYIEMYYRIVALGSEAYTALLLQQQRIS